MFERSTEDNFFKNTAIHALELHFQDVSNNVEFNRSKSETCFILNNKMSFHFSHCFFFLLSFYFILCGKKREKGSSLLTLNTGVEKLIKVALLI